MLPFGVALAQEPANHPIRFIVPFPPGSGTDTSARYFGRKLTELTGQPVVVDNKPGANGFIAVQAVRQAPADGTTVFVGSNSTLAVNVALFKNLPYNPQVDFAPLSMMMRAPTVVVVPQQSPYKTLADLIAAAKSQPGKLNHAGGSAGYQLMNEALNERAKVDIQNIPFKGATEALTAVASGTVDLAFADITASTELIKSGKVRALAVASDRRASVLPDVPHMGEAGLPGYGAYVWVGAMVSSKTPKPQAERLANLLAQIERMPETKAFYERIGAETMSGGAEEMRKFQAEEIERWKRIAVKAKVQQE
ncbi:tripartite tricarboxylate transporter substrate binding protein [Variovorax sp. J22R24]|uniref:Bug family tripartite tricarboxylate transporter substrate binding protein n=1 Tax=Variovorax gracilis TaxID=3053502 RepID=UPI002575E12C|nr:tripartite tricarboxylate transporter substrate binding protein [Variovorax sp. J22R24]MDM0108602.1 tripartite tricarboxylate transporter substrate binding protein [Variovorax sp. J22R24]